MEIKWASVETLPRRANVVIHGTNRKANVLRAKLASARPDIRIHGQLDSDSTTQSDGWHAIGKAIPSGCEAVTNQTNWIQTAWRLGNVGCETLHVLPICDSTHSKRNCIVVERARVIFVPIYKCAYSSFTEFFRAAFPDVAKAATGTGLNSFVDLLDERYRTFFKFSVVRHPVARSLSCFRDKYGRQESHDNIAKWQQPLLKLLDRKEIAFEDWLSFIASMPDTHSDPHWRSQYFTLYNSVGRCLVDRAYHLEHLSDHLSEISQRLGDIPVTLEQFNATRRSDECSASALDVVANRYHHDFDAFGYPR